MENGHVIKFRIHPHIQTLSYIRRGYYYGRCIGSGNPSSSSSSSTQLGRHSSTGEVQHGRFNFGHIITKRCVLFCVNLINYLPLILSDGGADARHYIHISRSCSLSPVVCQGFEPLLYTFIIISISICSYSTTAFIIQYVAVIGWPCWCCHIWPTTGRTLSIYIHTSSAPFNLMSPNSAG